MTRKQEEWTFLGEDSKFGGVINSLRSIGRRNSVVTVDADTLQRVKDLEQGLVGQAGMAQLRSAQGTEIDRLAIIDPLTELYNAKTFFKELKDELKRGRRYLRPVSLCLLTVDGFEGICQQYGTLTGNAVLKIVANVVSSVVRESDISARYGQDRFAIILPEANASQAAMIAERIRQRIGIQAVSHNWQHLKLTSSLGIASFPVNAQEYDELIARAELAMKQSADRGGDRVCMV